MAESYFIQKATLIHDGHVFHNQKVDIVIEEGKISEIGTNLPPKGSLISGKNIYVSEGWTDLRAHLTDPGFEHKDTLHSLLDTTASGGFTSVITLPHSEPPIADKSGVHYIINSTENHLVDLYPTGQINDSERSENLAELFDMHTAGAISFTNGDSRMSNGLLKKALLYTKPFGAKIISHPSDKSLENGGVVNESEVTLHTGLKTSPSIAEYVSVKEQIEIAKYCESALHLTCISTKESVDLIRKAKSHGLSITCDVAIANLCFTDEAVLSFDENHKVYPPLRSEADRTALVDGVNDGTIDAICSNHCPQNIESKMKEFDYAEYGSLTLQSVWPWYVKHLADEVELETFISKLTNGPRKVLGQAIGKMEEGESANLVVLDPSAKWILDESTSRSMSKNTAEWKENQVGKVLAVFNNKKVKINE